MTRTIHVELANADDGAELAEFLAVRGLASSVVATEDHCELDVGYAVDPEELLRQEVEAGLRGWLAEYARPLVPCLDREHGYVLRPPGD